MAVRHHTTRKKSNASSVQPRKLAMSAAQWSEAAASRCSAKSAVRAAGGGVRLPQRLRPAKDVIDPAAPDEKCITQAVQVGERFRRHALRAGERNQQTLGTAANGAANV